jgi:hypothetical protein
MTRCLLLLSLLFAGCRSAFVDAGVSFLPQVGVAAGGGVLLGSSAASEVFLEAEAACQWLDDKGILDDGNEEQGPWWQADVGAKHVLRPEQRRHLVVRYGAVWFRQTGVTGIIDGPGTYWGGFAGVGFETDLSPRLSVGPEVRVLVAQGEGSPGWEIVPQLRLHVVLRF